VTLVQGYFSISIIILSIFLLYGMYRIVKQIIGIINIPFISLFFLFKYIMLVYIGSIIMNVYYIEYYYNIGNYERKDLLVYMWLYASAGLFLIPLGMFISNAMLKYSSKKEIAIFQNTPLYISKTDYNNILFMIFILIFFISVITLFVYRSKIGGYLPIEQLFFNSYDAKELALLRSDATNNFIGKYWLYMLFIKKIPLLLLILVYFLKENSKKYRCFYYILLSYMVVVSVMDFQKAPLIKLIFLLALLKIYKDNYINKKFFLSILGISFGLIILMYIYFMGNTDKSFFEILAMPFERVFVGSIAPFYWWQLFQEKFGYLYGTSFPNPAGIFPFHWRRIEVEIMEFAKPELASLGIVGSKPTVFFANWFINFGPLMSMFSMILFGFIIQTIDIIMIRKLNKNKNIYLLSTLIVLIIYFGQFAETKFEGFIFSPNFYLPIVFFYVMYNIKKSLIKNKKVLYDKSAYFINKY
jgi:hypothetical protein